MVKTWVAVGLVVAALLGAVPAKANLLSADDEKLYRQAFDAAQKDHFDWALAAAGKAHSKLLDKVLHWLEYTRPNSGATFGEITDFIRANPDWPQGPVLLRRAEEAISVATPDSAVLAWFSDHAPQTVDGAMAFGKALIDAGERERAAKLLRKAWVNGDFGPLQEREFLANFRDLLTEQDQIARLDRLLWGHLDTAAQQQMRRVDDGEKALAKARMALADGASNAVSLAANLPDRLKDAPGLVYELLRYRRQHDMDDQAIALLKRPLREMVHPELWWVERAILARRALEQGRISQAYELARDHGQTEGAAFADAEWLSGWIALRFLGDRQIALDHFSRMYEHVRTAQSRSRAAYWAGRSAEALGKGDDAVRWFNLAAQHVTTFYGQLAASKIDHGQLWPLPADPLPSAEDIRDFEHQELVKAARMLGEIKETDLLRPFMLRMTEMAKTPGERALAAGLATTLGRADIAVTVAKQSERLGVPLIASGYPIPPLRVGKKPEQALVLGLIRQESAFHFEAVSSAGARGLMQLMPATAAKVAKALKVAFKRKSALASALTQNPGLNVKLGSAYLNNLLDEFNGSYILSVAAYNAGPSRVKKWIRDMGDPRNPAVDAVDWIESIPYSETRNYVQRVLEGVQIYRRRLGATDLARSLEGDLKR